jgi:hypothetical protein
MCHFNAPEVAGPHLLIIITGTYYILPKEVASLAKWKHFGHPIMSAISMRFKKSVQLDFNALR